MKATDCIARALAAHGVRFVFEMTGGMIAHLVDSLADEKRIRLVSCHHEQAAGFAAEGVARVTGIPGVALATSGPGATNLLTAVGSSFFDSIPMVFITGQVNRHELRPSRDVRQCGFQELDIVSVAKPLTKAAWQEQDAASLANSIASALEIASRGRQGPVLIDIPMDVQRNDVCVSADSVERCARVKTEAEDATIDSAISDLVACLKSASRPLILAGGGVRLGAAADLLRSFAAALGVPVASSLMGLDALPYESPLRVGMIGTYGNRWANLALGRCDVLIVLGSRLDVRQTGADAAALSRHRKVFRIDLDPAELRHSRVDSISHEVDVGAFLGRFLTTGRSSSVAGNWESWLGEIAEMRRRWPDLAEYDEISGINPARFMHRLSAWSGLAADYVVDVGQNQMWAAQSIELQAHQRFLTSGGMGSMGFALPAAMGAAIARNGAPSVVVAGDGGIQVNIQELETVARLALPLKIVILDNGCLGMVRQFQDDYFGGRHPSTVLGYGAPDFCAVAEAYGLPARSLAEDSDVERALRWLWSDPLSPAVLRVAMSQASCVSPKVAFGGSVAHTES